MPELDPNFRTHPAAEFIPRMSKERFAALRADIEERGLLVPIHRYNGAILDGRHRYRACQDLGIVPREGRP